MTLLLSAEMLLAGSKDADSIGVISRLLLGGLLFDLLFFLRFAASCKHRSAQQHRES